MSDSYEELPLKSVCNMIYEDEINRLRTALNFAAGLISTMPKFSDKHPEDVLKWIMEESAALGEGKND